MRRLTYSITLAVVVCLFAARSASASTITIGRLTYNADDPFFFGPFLTVFNESNLTTAGTFTDTSVDLFDGATLVHTVTPSLGTIAAGGSHDTSSDNLIGLVFNAARVTLTFTPTGSPSTHLSATASLTNLPASTEEIDLPETLITVDLPTTPTPVPEPGSMTLVGTGVLLALRRTARFRTRRRSASGRVATLHVAT